MPNLEIKGINYWTMLKKDISFSLEKSMPLHLVIHNSLRIEHIFDILNKTTYNSFCYVSLTKTFDNIIDVKSHLTNKRLFVVDCVTKGLFDKEDTLNCQYHEQIHSLEDIQTLLTSLMKTNLYECIIIDAISQFTSLTNKDGEDLKFIKSISIQVQNSKTSIILLHDDFREPRIKYLPRIYLPSILKVEIFEEIIDWQD